jgi:hypothetical protein
MGDIPLNIHIMKNQGIPDRHCLSSLYLLRPFHAVRHALSNGAAWPELASSELVEEVEGPQACPFPIDKSLGFV